MTYYEEFGLSPAASAEQIHRCYKALAKLLHPDQIPDENLKRLAELQMRRLNQIQAVLTDPQKRRQYDAELEARREPVRWPAEARRMRPRIHGSQRRLLIGLCAWGLPVGAIIILLLILSTDGAGARPLPAPVTPAEVAVESPPVDAPAALISNEPKTVPPVSLREDRVDAGKLLVQSRTAESQMDALRMDQQSTREEMASTARPASGDELPPNPIASMASRRVADTRPTLPVSHRDTGFAGHWYYVPAPRQHAANGMYLPEYIELHISEEAGVLHGRYQARYRVTDQAIEPEVFFRFEGDASAPISRFPWTGPGQSQGSVELNLVSADRIEVTWSATQLSADLNLASGSAQLLRQREP